jgi:aminoglycoside phosphotransferase
MLPRRILRNLPDQWRADLSSAAVQRISGGMSGAEVFRLGTTPTTFLKTAIAEDAQILRQEIVRTAWLAEHGIRVANVMRTHDDGRMVAMQTEALPGEPADSSEWVQERLISAIGRAVAKLHALPAVDCPFDESLAVRHSRARLAVDQGAVDAKHFASRNRNVAPRDLLARLLENPPPEDLVVVHGDLTLSNIVVAPDGGVGFIDCGHAGRADRYLDLGVLAAEIADTFGPPSVATFAREYGLQRWDMRKATYYADLYELF